MPLNHPDDDTAALKKTRRGTEDAEADYRGQIEAIDRSQMKIEFGMDGTILRANENYLRAFGYTNADIDRKNHSIFVTEEFKKSREYADFWDGLRKGLFQSGLFSRIGNEGKEVWIAASYNPVLDAEGRPVKVVKFATDMTAQIKIQNELKDTEARLKAILNSVVDGIITIDATGTIVSLNPAATKMFEYEESEVSGQNIKMLMPEPDRGAHDGHLARHESTGKSEVIGVGRELVGLTRTGRTFPMELTVTETSLQGQKFFVGLVRDITERSRQEKALKDAEARLKAILNSVVDGIITIDATGTIVSFNPAATKMFEYEEAEVFGKNIKMLMPEPDRGAHDGHLARHQSTGNSKVIGVGRELEGLTRSGRTFPMDLTVSEMSLQGHKFFVGLVRDVSERSRQEEALRKSEDFLDRTGRLAGVGGWELDLLTNEVNWSDETRRLHGFEADYVPTLEEGINFYAPEARPVIRAAVERAITEGKDWEVVVPVIRADGERIWARVTATVQFANGKPVRLAGAFQDVTARVAEQDALKNANERAALAAESCGIGIWDWDLRKGVLTCDSLLYQLFGLKPEPGEAHDLAFWAGRLHPGDRVRVEGALREATAGIKPYDIEFRIVWDDASIHHVKASGAVTRDKDGAAIRMVGTNMDITERKLAEAESVRNMQALMRSNQELDAFAYAASHDLKAPLRVIHNASTWIEEDLEGKLTAETQENMGLLRSRVRRMDRLLDDLLEYSRIGRATDGRDAEAISGTDLMENILGLLSPPEGFIVDASSTLAGIEVSRMPLQQILINLISNAIKHHDKKTGLVQVSVEDLGALFRFSVKDDGPGIPAQYHEKIFKMFQTLKPRDQVEGSGMGLAMVRKHVDVAGGELHLESAVGQGSIFSFTWPKDTGSTNKTKHKFTQIGEAS